MSGGGGGGEMIIHSLLPTDLLFKVTEGGVEDRVGAPSDAAKVALIVTHTPKARNHPFTIASR